MHSPSQCWSECTCSHILSLYGLFTFQLLTSLIFAALSPASTISWRNTTFPALMPSSLWLSLRYVKNHKWNFLLPYFVTYSAHTFWCQLFQFISLRFILGKPWAVLSTGKGILAKNPETPARSLLHSNAAWKRTSSQALHSGRQRNISFNQFQ